MELCEEMQERGILGTALLPQVFAQLRAPPHPRPRSSRASLLAVWHLRNRAAHQPASVSSMLAVYCWLLNSYVQEKAKGLLVAEDGSVPVPVPVADTP